jgi:hypothetical protein
MSDPINGPVGVETEFPCDRFLPISLRLRFRDRTDSVDVQTIIHCRVRGYQEHNEEAIKQSVFLG